MVKLFIHHKVANYATWRPVFDGLEDDRRAAGSSGHQVFRNAADPNEIVVIETYGTLEQAQNWSQSSTIREAMQRAGVVSQPELLFLEEV